MNDADELKKKYGKYLTPGEKPVQEFQAGFYKALATDNRIIFIRAFPKAFIPVPYTSVNNIEHHVYLVWDSLVRAAVFLGISGYGYLQSASFDGLISSLVGFMVEKIPEFESLFATFTPQVISDVLLVILPVLGAYYLLRFVFSLSGRLKISLKGSPSIRIGTPLTKDVGELINLVELSSEGKKPVSEEQPQELEGGYIYLVKEYKPDKSLKLFFSQMNKGNAGLYLSRTNPEQVRRDYEDDPDFLLFEDKIHMYWLTDALSAENSISPDLDQLFAFVSDFIERNNKTTILLDGLEYLVGHSHFEQVLTFIEGVKDKIGLVDSNLIIPISPRALGEKEQARLEREVRRVF